MKCPKCGYNSFEFLDKCKKCSGDLTEFKKSNGIRAIFLPATERISDVVTQGWSSNDTPHAIQAGQLSEDLPFTWEETAAGGEETAVSATGESFVPGERMADSELEFGDLLESNPTLEKELPTAAKTQPTPTSPVGFGAAGEFEMDDIFGEQEKEETVAAVQTNPQQQRLDGDFDFLFDGEEENKN